MPSAILALALSTAAVYIIVTGAALVAYRIMRRRCGLHEKPEGYQRTEGNRVVDLLYLKTTGNPKGR